MSKIVTTSAIAPEYPDQKIQIGPAIITEEPTHDRDIASKIYVDTAIASGGVASFVDYPLTYGLPYCSTQLSTTATLTRIGDYRNLTIPFMDDALINRFGAIPKERFQITFSDVALSDLGVESASCGSVAIYVVPAGELRTKYITECYVTSASGFLSIIGLAYYGPAELGDQFVVADPAPPVPAEGSTCEISGVLNLTWYVQ